MLLSPSGVVICSITFITGTSVIHLSLPIHLVSITDVCHAFKLYVLIFSLPLCVSSGLSPLYSPVSFCGAPLGPNQKRIQDLSLNSMIGMTVHIIINTIWQAPDMLHVCKGKNLSLSLHRGMTLMNEWMNETCEYMYVYVSVHQAFYILYLI